MINLSEIFGDIPMIFLDYCQKIPNFFYVCQSASWLTSLLKLDKYRDISSSRWGIYLNIFGYIHVRQGQFRSGQARSDQVGLGQVRSSQARSSQVRSGQVRSGQVISGQVKRSWKSFSSRPLVIFCILLYFRNFQDSFWTLDKLGSFLLFLGLLLFLRGSASETSGLVYFGKIASAKSYNFELSAFKVL